MASNFSQCRLPPNWKGTVFKNFINDLLFPSRAPQPLSQTELLSCCLKTSSLETRQRLEGEGYTWPYVFSLGPFLTPIPNMMLPSKWLTKISPLHLRLDRKEYCLKPYLLPTSQSSKRAILFLPLHTHGETVVLLPKVTKGQGKQRAELRVEVEPTVWPQDQHSATALQLALLIGSLSGCNRGTRCA